MAQPNNILLNFQNINDLSGQNTMYYYYNDGLVQISGSENINEPKYIELSNQLLSKTTRIKSRGETLTGGSPYTTTDDGVTIPYGENDEIYLCHNYTGNTDVAKAPSSTTVSNSWFYDTDKHRAYRIYMVMKYDREWRVGDVTYYNWHLRNAHIVYRSAEADDNDGAYTFTTRPTKLIGITGSVVVDTPNGFATWPQINLNLYKNSTLLTSETIAGGGGGISNTRLTVRHDLLPSTVNLNDQIKMSVSVGGNDSFVIEPLTVPEYTMSFSTEEPPEENSFLGIPSSLDLNSNIDCQPTFNNANDTRLSTIVQDVDYSSDILHPINLALIRNDSAIKAPTPDSNYSQYAHTLNRYWGVKTNRTNFNTASFQYFDWDQRGNSLDDTLGTNVSPLSLPSSSLGLVPNVEHLNTYIGYFNQIIDPYPVLNGKTAFFVQFLVDRNIDSFNPALSVPGLQNFIQTYKLIDSNGRPTEVKPSVTDVNEDRELGDLAVFSDVSRVAVYPSPILFSQNSSNAHSSTIPVTGSNSDYRDISGTFWVKTGSQIHIGSNAFQAVYDSGSFYMGSLDYTAGPNSAFPLGVEPTFTRFPAVTDPFTIEVGDEIRFENSEEQAFRINTITTGSVGADTRTFLTLDREVGDAINLNFFVLRRFKTNPNMLILDIQKPYDIPPSASSAPGILTTRYQTTELQTNPDTVVNALVERGLI